MILFVPLVFPSIFYVILGNNNKIAEFYVIRSSYTILFQRVCTSCMILCKIFHLKSFCKLDKTAAKLNFSADEVDGPNSKSDVLHKIDREFEF